MTKKHFPAAVEIDGEHYRDGGFAGNPTITPLVRECKSRDTILVQINPVDRRGYPRSAREQRGHGRPWLFFET
jgi:NTE family protein